VKLALAPELAGVTGKYYSDEKEASVAPSAGDPDLARRFYEKSCALTGIEPLPEP
jgi:hypothetical protein